MSFFWGRQQRVSLTDAGADRRSPSGGGKTVSSGRAMHVSMVWAAVRLRADLESSFPIDVFKRTNGSTLLRPVATPSVLIDPSEWAEGHPMSIGEWLYATRTDLDRYGNTFGIITARDGGGLPKQIRPVSAEDVSIVGKGMKIIEYRVKNKTYQPADIWHERQYVTPGSPLGLSPIAHAAQTLAGHLAAMDFALAWFDRGASPSVILKNTAKTFDATEASRTKRRIAASLQDGMPMVVDKNWDVEIAAARAKDAAFLDLMGAGSVDIARFFGVPADLIDAAVSGQSVTYANISQRNLQFLIMNLGPAVKRRETALSRLVTGGAFVKLNSDALLRMDPKERRLLMLAEVGAGVRTVDEYRATENQPPLEVDDDAASTSEKAQAIARLLQMGYLAVGKGITSDELRTLANQLGADLTIPGPDFTPEPPAAPGIEGAS
jgi:HK97 family phage portal protein